MSNERVRPILAGGFRDYLPAHQIQRAAILRQVTSIYERFGFDPLETPAVERLQVLTGGESSHKLIYRTFPSRAGGWPRREPDQRVALRFDLTVPLARVVAANPELPRPFKRYQVGNVWRGEKPQLGRFREFLQFDADIVGAATAASDAEMVVIMSTVLRELGFERFTIGVNDRKILNALATKGGFDGSDDEIAAVLRVLDKIDKIGLDGVLAELAAPAGSSEGDADALGLDADAVALIERYLTLGSAGSPGASGGADNASTLAALDELLGDVPAGREGIDELRTIQELVAVSGVADDDWRIDPTIARGLDYYTGPVWEAVLDDAREIGTVYAGGRYDRLVGRFMTGAAVPCTGISVGIDRLFAGMDTLGMLTSVGTVTEVLVVSFAPELATTYQRMATELRAADLRTAIYFGEDTSFKAQISYAARNEIPVVVIHGPDDEAAGVAQVKDMRRREQQSVPLSGIVDAARTMLDQAPG